MTGVRILSTLAVAASMACHRGSGGAAQVPMQAGANFRIGSDVSCASCSIVIDTVATLRNIFSFAGSLARDTATGAIYAVDRSDNLLKVFSAEGRLMQTIGRRGGGPGEYEDVRNVLLGPGQTIHVLDGVLGRHTIFTRGGAVLGTTRIEVAPGALSPAVLRTDGKLVVNGLRSDASGAVYTVNLIDTAGHIIRSVDPVAHRLRDHWWLRARLFWNRANDELLVARRYAPVIDVYAPDLTKKYSITRAADWFPERERQAEPSDGAFEEPFSPNLVGIWEDGRGRLWLQMLAPSPAWEPRKKPARYTVQAYRAVAARPRIETIIEVLDIDRRRVLARARIEGGVGATLGGGFIADYLAETAAGEPQLRILRVSLNDDRRSQ